MLIIQRKSQNNLNYSERQQLMLIICFPFVVFLFCFAIFFIFQKVKLVNGVSSCRPILKFLVEQNLVEVTLSGILSISVISSENY